MVKSFVLLAAIAATSAFGVLPAAACPHDDSTSAADVKELNVAQAAPLLKDGKATAFDANNESTRAKFGVIPGAVLLTNVVSYSLDQLPADKTRPLVFYCANTRCTASDTAAHRATDAGYRDVAVLRDGIQGWKQAGQPTAPVSRS
jgi:rhodanese-related sulfurtransferase